MKKLLLFFVVALLCVSCGKLITNLQRNDWRWSVKNNTEQTLKFKYPYPASAYQSYSEYREFEIKPGAGIRIYSESVSYKRDVTVSYYFDKSAENFREDVSWQILSEDGIVLKTWKYSDRELPDQRFFKESSWDYHSDSGEWLTALINDLTFQILPEDIQ